MDRVELRKRIQELLKVISFRSHSGDYKDAVVELKSLGRKAVYVLSEQLWHKDRDLRRDAARALGLLGPDGMEAIPSLIRMLGDDQSPSETPEWALGQMGAIAIPELIEAVRSSNQRVRRRALDALRECARNSDDVIDALACGLQDEAPDLRNIAARLLGLMGPRAARAVPAFVRALSIEQEGWNRYMMRVALGYVGPAAVPALVEALTDESQEIRKVAACALSTHSWEYSGTIARSLACIKNESNEDVRTDLTSALEELAKDALEGLKDAVAGLRSISQTDPSGSIRTMSVLAYEQIIENMGECFPIGDLELAELKPPCNQRPRKRVSAERDKCLLALLDTCLEWTEPTISERRIHRSELLSSMREALGLDKEISLSSIHKHLEGLATACGIANILQPVEKRQTSQFAEGAIDNLRRIRSGLVARIRREEERWRREQEPLDNDE
jgi:hypothetical protein